MDENSIFISNIFSTPEWKEVLITAVNFSDGFDIVYPNGEYDEDNPLLAGMPDFTHIPNISVVPWPNMKDSSIYKGTLDDHARNLILHHMFIENQYDTLWQFSLYKGNLEVLTVSDFNCCHIEPIPEFVNLLAAKNIDLFSLSDE